MKQSIRLAVALVMVVCCLARDPTPIPPKNPNDPERLPQGVTKKALVIGGGLAGLSAAIELADRGYDVTIKEKMENSVGGKLATKPVQALGQTFYVEHGFHAWFGSYHQFKDIRNRLKINDNFVSWPSTQYVFKNYKPENIYNTGPYPLNLLGIVLRSPNLKITDAISSYGSLEDLLFYDFDKVNEKYDNISFKDWANEKNVAAPFYDIILQPALSVTLNERDIFSAAEMLQFQQIYFLTNEEADQKQVAKINYYHAVLKPWVDYLESKNTKIVYNTSVESFKIDPKTMSIVGTNDDSGPDNTVYDSVVIAADIGAVQNMFLATMKNYVADQDVSKVLQNCYNNNIGRMKIAPDYKVMRVWFDQQLNNTTPNILETPDFTPINLIAQYHLLEEEYAEWANKTGGSVIEFHLYTWSKHFPKDTPDDKVWELISPTVKEIYPDIFTRNFKVLFSHVNSFENFSSFQKNLRKYRPFSGSLTDNGLNNAYLAGDWVNTAYPAHLMERAVSTGREAANWVLLKDHVRQAEMLTVNKQGPGL